MHDGHKVEDFPVCPLDIGRLTASGENIPGLWVEIPLLGRPCVVEDTGDGQNGSQYVQRGENQDGQVEIASAIREPVVCRSLNHSNLYPVQMRVIFPVWLQHYSALHTGLIVRIHRVQNCWNFGRSICDSPDGAETALRRDRFVQRKTIDRREQREPALSPRTTDPASD